MKVEKSNDVITIKRETDYYGIMLEWREQSRVLEFNNINFNDKDDIELDYKVDPDVKFVNEFDIILVSSYDDDPNITIGSIVVLDISLANINEINSYCMFKFSEELKALTECIMKQKQKQNSLLNRVLYIKSIEIYPSFRGLELGGNIINLLLETYLHVKNIEFSSCILALGPSRAMSYPEYEDEYNELSDENFNKIRIRLRRFYKKIGFVKWKTKNRYHFMIRNLKDRD